MNPFPWWGDLLAGFLSLYCALWVRDKGPPRRTRWTSLSFAIIGVVFLVEGFYYAFN